MKYIFLRITKFDVAHQTQVEWKIYSDDKKLIHGSSAPLSLAQAAAEINKAAPKNPHIIIFLPGELVSCHTVNLNRQQMNYLRDSLPFVMEEQVADEVENLHFALGNKLSEEGDEVVFPVAVIKKAYIENLVKELHELQIVADEIIPEFLVLPEWSVIFDKDKALFRSNLNNGFAADANSIQVLIDAATQMELSKPTVTTLDAEHGVTEALSLLYLENPQSEYYINLLQGKFEKNIADFSKPFKWKKLAFAAVAGVLIYVSLNLGIALYFKFKANQAYNEALAIYKTSTPADANSSDAREHMEKKIELLKNTNGGMGFLSVIREVSAKIGQLPPDAVTLNQIEYDAEKGTVLELKATDGKAVEVIRQSLEEGGKKAKIESSNPEEGGVKAKIMVSE